MYLDQLDPQLPPNMPAKNMQFITASDFKRANDIAWKLWDWLGGFIGPKWNNIWERIETEAWDIVSLAHDRRPHPERRVHPVCIDGKHAFKIIGPGQR